MSHSTPVGRRLLNRTVRLDRRAVPALLEQLERASYGVVTPVVLRELVCGGWTTVPAQALRGDRTVMRLCLQLDAPDVRDSVLSAEVCARPGPGSNRLGHCAERQYPGPCGWTPAYGLARVEARPRRAAYVRKMEAFTLMAREAIARAESLGMADVVRCELLVFRDANQLDRAKARVQALLSSSLCDG